MENTLENKAKFFAQYWGQEIMKSNNDGWEIKKVDHNSIYPLYEEDEDFLILKPLSSITDEDAIEVGNLLFPFISGKIIRVEINSVDELTLNIKAHRKTGYNEDYKAINVPCADYLRSKGYCLPWMGLSCEALIEYGWVKICAKNEK